MATLRKTTNQEREVFNYLNELRTSGITNMFLAAPYLTEQFDGISLKEAKTFILTWMRIFDKEGNYDEIDSEEPTDL